MLQRFFSIKKFLGRRGSGSFSSFLHGSSIDIADNRHYTAGDEKRSINWKMSAKYDQLFVNLFHDDKAIDVHLCCDINYNWQGENTESFLWFFAELTDFFRSRKAHIWGCIGDEIFGSIEKLGYQKKFVEAALHLVKKSIPVYSSRLADMLAVEQSMQKRRLIIIVSDFLSYGDEEKKIVGLLRQKCEVKLVQIPTQEGRKMDEAMVLTHAL